jgi:hypothetical protein
VGWRPTAIWRISIPLNEYEWEPKIVAATKGGETEYWAVTFIREDAVDAVRNHAPEWRLTLTERRLPGETWRALKMGRHSVRKLPRGTKFLGE